MPLGDFHLGCAGYAYHDWVGNFYPLKLVGNDSSRQLNYYQQHFSTVEINSTFYGHPSDAMIRKLTSLISPKKFKLVLKATRTITHEPGQGLVLAELEIFLKRVQPLKGLLAMILIQCPSNKKITLDDLHQVRDLLARAPFCEQPQPRLAFEFRNAATLQDKSLQAFMQEQQWITVYHPNTVNRFTQKGDSSSAKQEYPLQPLSEVSRFTPPTSNTIYVRLHGGRDDHAYNYVPEELDEIATQIHEWRRQGLVVYVFFLNCLPPQPQAPAPKELARWSVMPKNALMLKRKVHGLANEQVPLAPKQPRSSVASLFSKQLRETEGNRGEQPQQPLAEGKKRKCPDSPMTGKVKNILQPPPEEQKKAPSSISPSNGHPAKPTSVKRTAKSHQSLTPSIKSYFRPKGPKRLG